MYETMDGNVYRVNISHIRRVETSDGRNQQVRITKGFTEPGVTVPTCHPRTLVVEAGGS